MSLLSIIILSAAFLNCELSAWQISFSTSFGGSRAPAHAPAHDMKSQPQLSNLYNQKVVQAESVKRSLSSSGTGLGFLDHSGVRVTLEDGTKYLVHKGKDYGISSDTVVVGAEHMSNNWQVEATKSVQGKTVSDFVKAGGSDYSFISDNCHDATKRMMDEK